VKEFKWADRIERIDPFRVMELMGRSQQLQSQGVDIVHLEVGEPDFVTAAPILKAGQQALEQGRTAYTPATGLPELREKIAQYYLQKYNFKVDSNRIILTSGASGALMLTTALLVNPGDGVLLADPGYPCNRHFVELMGGQPQAIKVDVEDGFQINLQQLEQCWGPDTRGIMLASPANPTGRVLDKKLLQNIVSFVDERNGYIIMDEIYHGLSYDAEDVSVLEISNDAFVINSFSKYFGMTGWRLGWVVVPEQAVESVTKMAQNFYIAPPTISQYAALAAFSDESIEILEQRRFIFQQRRDFLFPRLQDLGFIIPDCPEGAFYLYANIKNFSADSERFCNELLAATGVAVTPGTDFGKYKSNEHIRFAYTTGIEQLEKAVHRIEKFVNKP